MANTPIITNITFKRSNDTDDGLEMGSTKENKASIEGAHLSKDDIVIAVSAKGGVWIGRIFTTTIDGKKGKCKKLKFINVPLTVAKKKTPGKTLGSEDITSTVTNPITGPSNPITTPVEVIP